MHGKKSYLIVDCVDLWIHAYVWAWHSGVAPPILIAIYYSIIAVNVILIH